VELPARIGKYELEEYLGGGMSRVYRARDTVIGRTVAVKILTEEGREDQDVKARFLAEARTAGNISHDNILGIYDFGEDEEHRPFMVMEFLRGEDLRHAIKNGHTGDLRTKLQIALQLGRALEYIHSQKIIHRDLKPENVRLTGNGQVKLMDFGISKAEGLDLTRTGFMVGTPYYMAPEQVNGATVTPQADVYAFGVLLFELLTGKHPIAGDSIGRVFYAILNEPLDLDELRQARVPDSLCQLVARCTAKTPGDRPEGFGPICAELERALAIQEQLSIDQGAATLVMPERQPERPPTRRRIWLWPAAALAGIVVVASGWFLGERPKTAQPPPVPSVSAPAPSTPDGMVLVPAGSFRFGEKKEPVSLPAFYIDKTEVTNEAYLRFAGEMHHTLPEQFPHNMPDYPVVNVTIEDARAFCSWAHKRLPTGQEWEKAARGMDGREFPWGDGADPSRANLGTKMLRPANDFLNGASPYGALQMVGNVWEFVGQAADPGKLMIRGGSFNEPLQEHLIWDSKTVPADAKSWNIGFRCVRDGQ
jgi:serine/threonine-protein kinase